MPPATAPTNPPPLPSNQHNEKTIMKEKPPSKIISVYRCYGTTHLDNVEFQAFGKPKCYGIEQKLKTSMEQQSLLRSMLSNKMNKHSSSSNDGGHNTESEQDWTVKTLEQFKQQRARALASHEYYPIAEDECKKKEKNEQKGSDEFSYTCIGRTNYVVLENTSNDENSQPSKFDARNNPTQFTSDAILTGPPKCTPGISVKTINKNTQQYSLDLGILRIEMLNDDFEPDVDDNEHSGDVKSVDVTASNLSATASESTLDEPKSDEIIQDDNTENFTPSPSDSKSEREMKREEFLKQREKIYKDFEKERRRFFDKQKDVYNRKTNKNDKIESSDEDAKPNYRNIRRRTQRIFAPETPESRHAEHEARRREREEAMDYLLEKSKEQTEQLIELGNKTFGMMKKITSAVATELADEFPLRMLQSSERIVGQFGNTVGRCQKTAGMVYRFWTEDDDDDDDYDDDDYS